MSLPRLPAPAGAPLRGESRGGGGHHWSRPPRGFSQARRRAGGVRGAARRARADGGEASVEDHGQGAAREAETEGTEMRRRLIVLGALVAAFVGVSAVQAAKEHVAERY